MKQDTDILYSTLNVSKKTISRIIYNPDKYYYETDQPKKKFGKNQIDKNGDIRYRHLIPPVDSLKSIQSDICVLLQKITLPDCMFGSVKGSNNIINSLEHIENEFFFKVDLKNFFGNITCKQVHYTLMKHGYSWNVARIITRLTTHKYQLPQGAPSSPVIANLVFADTAKRLDLLARSNDITFTTYLDDLVFSSKKDFKKLHSIFLQVIKSDGFYTNYDKIQSKHHICEITGLRVGKGKIRLIPEMLKESLHNRQIRGYANSVKEHVKFYLSNSPTF
jgi:RNA-directed DNA polymerase